MGARVVEPMTLKRKMFSCNYARRLFIFLPPPTTIRGTSRRHWQEDEQERNCGRDKSEIIMVSQLMLIIHSVQLSANPTAFGGWRSSKCRRSLGMWRRSFSGWFRRLLD